MSNVTVGCKLPHGLVITVGGRSVTLNGVNSSRIIGGYGLTVVDKDFFEAWKIEFSTSPLVRNDLIFDQDTAAKAESQAKEQAEVLSGLEPIDKDANVLGVKEVSKDD